MKNIIMNLSVNEDGEVMIDNIDNISKWMWLSYMVGGDNKVDDSLDECVNKFVSDNIDLENIDEISVDFLKKVNDEIKKYNNNVSVIVFRWSVECDDNVGVLLSYF
jgi:hypothetical protein